MNESTTTDFSKFGSRERKLARELLQASEDQGFPEDFNDDEVTIMMNRNSGCVFFTNADYQVAMMNGDNLETFYNCGNCGNEGFAEEVLTKSGKCKECKEKIR
jgi:DNA-directed RNA polymerase subunit RPC12/RpoP